MPDGMIAAAAVAAIQTFGVGQVNRDTPFFLAVGFHKPHLPHIAPAKYFDLYPMDNISLPRNATRHAPVGAPDIAWNKCDEFLSYADTKRDATDWGFSRDRPFNDSVTRDQRRAYYAAASFTDAQIGRVLEAIDAAGLTETTVIALWGDHGWHLGENNEWAKHTAMARANRAPLLFHHPAIDPGVGPGYAEFVDIFPTLADLAGIGTPPLCSTSAMSQSAQNCMLCCSTSHPSG